MLFALDGAVVAGLRRYLWRSQSPEMPDQADDYRRRYEHGDSAAD